MSMAIMRFLMQKSARRSFTLPFEKVEDAQEFYNAVNSL